MTIGDRIKYLRNKDGYSQKELGEKLKVTDSVVSRYESNTIPISDEITINLSNIFNVTTDYILKGNELEQPLQIAASMKKGLYLPDVDDDEKELILNTVRLLQNRRKEDK